MYISFLGNSRLLDKIDTDFYTGKYMPRKTRSIEHLLPKSKGGANSIFNYAVCDSFINSQRSNVDLKTWFSLNPDYLKNAKQYIKKYYDFVFDGQKYGKIISETLRKMGINI